MYITISDISKRIYPLDYVDNRSGALKIGLRRITFCLDWYNASGGYVTVDTLPKEIHEKANIELNKMNGILKITPVKDTDFVHFDSELLKRLKFKFDPGADEYCRINAPCESYEAIDLIPVKLLNIHCNQINSKDNFFDMSPSTLLTTVPVGDHRFGDVITHNFTSPEYKKLNSGALTDLKIDLLDQDNKEIIHHTKIPVSCTLEIIP